MAKTVQAAFQTFYDEINLSGDHREIANTRKDHLVGLLKNDFEILDAFATGSIPKYTALKSTADLDIMVVLHHGKHVANRTPLQLLESVQSSLSEYRTNVRKNGQAVTLHYKTWPSVDIVPVSRILNSAGAVSHYDVPDANYGTWLKSRPRKLAAEIEAKSTECGQNFRRITKMIKSWNESHSNFLSSYHIEVLALRVLSGNLDDTPWYVFQFFEKARDLLASPIFYELGFADDYLTASDRVEVLSRVDRAITKSRDAWCATYDSPSDQAKAIEGWTQVFGDKFPSYG